MNTHEHTEHSKQRLRLAKVDFSRIENIIHTTSSPDEAFNFLPMSNSDIDHGNG